MLIARPYTNLVEEIKSITNEEFGIVDESGTILACTDENKIGTAISDISEVLEDKKDICLYQGWLYKRIFVKGKLECLIYLGKDSPDNRKFIAVLAVSVSSIRSCFDDKYDKTGFIKNVILDNVMPGDVTIKARELHIQNGVYRVAIVVKVEKSKDVHSNEIIANLFPNKNRDFIVVLDDESTAIIKEVKAKDDAREIDRTARIIYDTLTSEYTSSVHIGIGSITDNIKEIARSFKEAQTALHVGSIFENEKQIFHYENLGLGRLIYQLPATLCKLFLKEIFKEGTYEMLDSEMILTILKFFENNLNVSETSRQLYVHRNTLVYRLEKVKRITGLDLTKFDDAIVFKISMLVKKYLDKSHI